MSPPRRRFLSTEDQKVADRASVACEHLAIEDRTAAYRMAITLHPASEEDPGDRVGRVCAFQAYAMLRAESDDGFVPGASAVKALAGRLHTIHDLHTAAIAAYAAETEDDVDAVG